MDRTVRHDSSTTGIAIQPVEREIIWAGGDRHLFSNRLAQAREQLAREPGPLPRLETLRNAPTVDGYDYEDCVIHDYAPQARIKAPVAV